MNKFAIGAVLAAVVAGGTFVYAQSSMGGMDMGGMDMGGMNMGDTAAPASKAYAAAMEKMMASMAPYSGDADVDFARGMIPHHQAAIDMAKAQLEFGTDPVIRKLAEEVIAAQEAEIKVLQDWLATKGM